jgi:hypothetical protein
MCAQAARHGPGGGGHSLRVERTTRPDARRHRNPQDHLGPIGTPQGTLHRAIRSTPAHLTRAVKPLPPRLCPGVQEEVRWSCS